MRKEVFDTIVSVLINSKIEAENNNEHGINNAYIEKISDALTELKSKNEENWISTSTGLFPNEMEHVQVTFIGYNDQEPHCYAFAYRNDNQWFWTLDDTPVKVKITAWQYNCNPYKD